MIPERIMKKLGSTTRKKKLLYVELFSISAYAGAYGHASRV